MLDVLGTIWRNIRNATLKLHPEHTQAQAPPLALTTRFITATIINNGEEGASNELTRLKRCEKIDCLPLCIIIRKE